MFLKFAYKRSKRLIILVRIWRNINVINWIRKVDLNVKLFLNIKDKLHFVLLKEKNVQTVFTFPCSSACSMDEAVNLSAPHLDHNINVINIKTSCCNISANQNRFWSWPFKFPKSIFSLVLLHIAVNWCKLSKFKFFKISSFIFGFHKDNNFLISIFLNVLLDVSNFILKVLSYNCLVP